MQKNIFSQKRRTKKPDTKPEILVLRAYTYNLAEGAEGECLTENTMQISSDYLQTNVPKPHCCEKHPIPPVNGKASLSTHCVLQAKQNWAADFVNMCSMWCNYHIILQCTIKNLSSKSFIFSAVQLKSQRITVFTFSKQHCYCEF